MKEYNLQITHNKTKVIKVKSKQKCFQNGDIACWIDKKKKTIGYLTMNNSSIAGIIV
jgi:hypothetical protein